MTGNSENLENSGAPSGQTPHAHQARVRPVWFREELERLGGLFTTGAPEPAQASGENTLGAQSQPALNTNADAAQPPQEQPGARSQVGVVPDRFKLELERLRDRFRTADGRTLAVLAPDERVMVVLSRPERVTGADREQLAGMLAARYAAGATLAGLASVIRRSEGYVRTLIAEAGGQIRGPEPDAVIMARAAEKLAAELAEFRTVDGRTFAGLSPVEQEIVELSRPRWLEGAGREKLAGLLAGQHTAEVSIQDLSDLICRTPHLVRTLIVEAGGTVHTPAPETPAAPPEPDLDDFRTADGRPYGWLSPVEQEMVWLSRPGHANGAITGADRLTLAGLLADRYRDDVPLRELAELLNRSIPFVRTLIAETGTPIRGKGRPPGFTRTLRAVAGPNGPGSTVRIGEPRTWSGVPEPMLRVQPEDLGWSWTDQHVYTAELMVDLYNQGRSYTEVAAVTGYPADDIRAMVLAAGSARPLRVDEVYAAWRDRSRETLAKMNRTSLLLAWIDGAEADDLAVVHNVPADLLWDLIAAEMARLTPRALAYLTQHRPHRLPACTATACRFGCAHTCAATLPHPAATECGHHAGRLCDNRASSGTPWPPHAAFGDIGDRITLNDDGTVTWNSFSNHATG